MDNRDYMKAFGEWPCSIAPNPMAKSLMHDSLRSMYERDYVIVTNLYNGFEKIPTMSINRWGKRTNAIRNSTKLC